MINFRHSFLLLLACSASTAFGRPSFMSKDPVTEPAQPEIISRAGFEQRLGETVPSDVVLTDETGKSVTVGDLLGGRPVILNLAYYRCPMLCNMVINGMADAMRATGLSVGPDYRVMTVSFDPSDTAEVAAAKKANHLKSLGQPGAETGWSFLVGADTEVHRLADSVGFTYALDEKSGEYAHASGIVVLTPEGRISHYFYGVEYPAKDLRLALVEASAGKIGNAVDKLLLFCYHYDPITGRYSAAIMSWIRAGAALTVFALGIFIGRSLFRGSRTSAPMTTAHG